MTVSNATKVQPAVSCETDVNELTLKVTFADGSQVAIDATTLNEDVRNMAILHGLKQKLVDAAAIPRNIDTGASATMKEKMAAVREVFDRITAADGTWNKVRTAGDGAVQTGGLLVRALMKLGNKSREEIVAQLDGLNKEQRAALRANKRVVEAMASLRETSEESEDLLESILG